MVRAGPATLPGPLSSAQINHHQASTAPRGAGDGPVQGGRSGWNVPNSSRAALHSKHQPQAPSRGRSSTRSDEEAAARGRAAWGSFLHGAPGFHGSLTEVRHRSGDGSGSVLVKSRLKPCLGLLHYLLLLLLRISTANANITGVTGQQAASQTIPKVSYPSFAAGQEDYSALWS